MSSLTFESSISLLQQFPRLNNTTNALILIRNGVDWPKNKNNIARLRQSGCLKHITAILGSSKKTCIDLALSILGNCLMDNTCSKEVLTQHNIISVLNHLFKKFPKEDSINGRAFRVIGNICRHSLTSTKIVIEKNPDIVKHLVDVVKQASMDEIPEGMKISEATIITGLRALRVLLNCHTKMTLLKEFGALKAIGALFIKYSTEWQNHKQHEKMLLHIITLIQEYSRYKYYNSVMEMRNTERGDALLHLAAVLLLDPKRIVKIVMNLINSCQLQSELPVPEIFAKFVEVLENHSIVKKLNGDCIGYLHCLCYMLDHPANRHHERCGKAVPSLIKALKELDKPTNVIVESCTLLIHTLNKFKYDEKLMAEQLKHGIIPVLIDKLSWLVGPPDVINMKHANEKKRKYVFGPTSPVLSKKRFIRQDTMRECSPSSSNSSDDEMDLFTAFRLTQPSPSLGASSDAESNTSWSEPIPNPSRSLLHDSDSDDYSPVCSEVDESEFPSTVDSLVDFYAEKSPTDPYLDEHSRDTEDYSQGSKAHILTKLKDSLLDNIVRIIRSYIKLRPLHPHLANVDLLMQLSKCSITYQFDVKNVICDIVACHEHLISLMKSNFVEKLYEMRNIPSSHDSCSKCLLYGHFTYTILRRITETAESGAGRGDIAHVLLKGDIETKQKLVVVIPYIIGNRSILGKLMIQCGGLRILMNLLRDNSEEDNRRSVKVICQMALKGLFIVNPRRPYANLVKPTIDPVYILPEACANVVSFKLEDGNTVNADRDFLISKSDYFSGLLDGHFRERNENEICLSDVKVKSFKPMLFLLHNVDKVDASEVVFELDTLLDIVLLCDRFLLVQLCMTISDVVEQFHITTETVPIIYNWSVATGTNLLRIECVAYALVADVDDGVRFSMFEKLFNLGYKDQLLDDIEKLLLRYLNQNVHSPRERDLKGKASHGKMKDRLLKNV